MAGEHVEVRDARGDDVEAIARVHVESWRETYFGVLSERFFGDDVYPRRVAFWTDYLSRQPRPGRVSVAVQDGAVVGFACSGESSGPDAERGAPAARPVTLFSLYVLAAAHGTGAGQALLDAVVGRQAAQLWVLAGNARATAFYRRNGFEFDGVEHRDASDAALIELRMVR